MTIPAAKNLILAFRQIALSTLVLLAPLSALADVEGDFQQGLTSFRNGDLFGAMGPLRRAADAGHAEAQAKLGYILDLGEFNEEALRYYRMSAEQEFPEGLYGLATMILSGEGTEKDPVQGYALMKKAALKGYDPAWNALADGLLNDLLAPPTDQPDAEAILTKSAEGGYLRSVDALAEAYAKGGYGIATNPEKSALWAAKAKEIRASSAKK